MSSLTDLDLSNNALNHLPHHIGNDLFKLLYLDVSYNNLATLPQSFDQLQKLQVLKLKNNGVRELGVWLKGTTSLIQIDASNNVLDTINGGVGCCLHLQSLLLGNNRLVVLPPEMAVLTHLQELALRHNHLTHVMPEVGQMSSLQDLDLTANKLTGPLPPEIGRMKKLRSMDISSNYNITALPETLGNLTRLQVINASE